MKTARYKVNGDVLNFWHPYATGADGYALKIRKGLAKFSHDERAAILAGVETLLTLRPDSLDAIKGGHKVSPIACKWYFATMPAGSVSANEIEALFLEQTPTLKTTDWRTLAVVQALQRKVAAHVATIAERDLTIAMLQKELGQQHAAAQSLTIGEALAHYTAHFAAATVATTKSLIANARATLEAIGLGVRVATVTKHDLESKLGTVNVVKRTKAIKRFFAFMSSPKNEGGLELGNPAKNLAVKWEATTPAAETLDPRDILERCELDEAQRALIALMGYAGLRLSEAAGLEWSDIDFTARVIYIRPNDARQTLKTSASKRVVKPFPNIWSTIDTYRNSHPGASGLMFTQPDGTPWTITRDGNTASPELSQALTKAVRKVFTFKSKLNLCLRHFWSTKMCESEFKHLESAMGAHSAAISRKHYQNQEKLIKAAQLNAI